VHFSNHTGYNVFKGHKLTPDQFADVVDGLEANGILDLYTHLLTGYIGNLETLESIFEFVTKMKTKDLFVIIDPGK
jgi:pyridoxine kinase